MSTARCCYPLCRAEIPEDALGPEQEIAMVLQLIAFLVGHSEFAGRRFGLIFGGSNAHRKPTRDGIGLYFGQEPLCPFGSTLRRTYR